MKVVGHTCAEPGWPVWEALAGVQARRNGPENYCIERVVLRKCSKDSKTQETNWPWRLLGKRVQGAIPKISVQNCSNVSIP